MNFRKLYLTLPLGLLMLSACTDEKYDLSNLDKTIHVGSSEVFFLPSSSTGDIKLQNLFDLAEDGAIEEIDSTYYLNKGGKSNPEPIHINEIRINRPSDQSFAAHIILNPESSVKKKVMRKEGGASPLDFTYIYEITDKAKTEIKDAQDGNIIEDVLSITDIGFEQNKVNLKVNISGDEYKIFKAIHFDNLALHLPKGLKLSSCTYKSNDTTYELLATDAQKEKAYNGVIEIFNGEDTSGYDPHDQNDPLVITLVLDGADVADNLAVKFKNGQQRTPTNKKGEAKFEGEFQLKGYARLTNNDLDVAAITTAAIAIGDPSLIPTDGNYWRALNTLLPSLDFKGDAKFQKDFIVSTFSGALQHEIENPGTIKLENLPDFLTEDGVSLNLANPQLFLKLHSEIPTKVETSALLVATSKKGKVVVPTGDISYDGTRGDTLLHALAIDINDLNYPKAYQHLTYRSSHTITNLDSLLINVPDEIEIKGTDADNGKLLVKLPECKNISVKKDYRVSFEYLAYCSLTFGEGFKIVYRDTETGMDLGDDIDDLDFQGVVLRATANSDLPYAFELTAKPVDKSGNVISGLNVVYSVFDSSSNSYVKTNTLNIRSKANGTKDSDRIQITIEPTSGKMNDYMKSSAAQQLDGIKYEAVIKSDQAGTREALKTNSKLKLVDIQIGIQGGVTLIDKD